MLTINLILWSSLLPTITLISMDGYHTKQRVKHVININIKILSTVFSTDPFGAKRPFNIGAWRPCIWGITPTLRYPMWAFCPTSSSPLKLRERFICHLYMEVPWLTQTHLFHNYFQSYIPFMYIVPNVTNEENTEGVFEYCAPQSTIYIGPMEANHHSFILFYEKYIQKHRLACQRKCMS